MSKEKILEMLQTLGNRFEDPKIQRRFKEYNKTLQFIFPDLDAGNIGVKLVQNFANATTCGPLLQGFNKPVSDLSRSAPLEDIIGVISMTVICAQDIK